MFYFFSPRSRLRLMQIVLAGIMSAIAVVTTPKYLNAQNLPETGSITIRSDSQEANSETGIITASGNVQINYPAKQIQATSAQAQYYSRERRLVLNGNVYVIQAGNSMRAESMTYLVDEARFIATPQSDRQVESTYIVNDPVPSSNN
jgi:lipopolysaccharide export system protein LptA